MGGGHSNAKIEASASAVGAFYLSGARKTVLAVSKFYFEYFNSETTTRQQLIRIAQNTNPIRCVQYAESLDLLAIGHEDAPVRVYRATDGTLLYMLPKPDDSALAHLKPIERRGHGGAVSATAFGKCCLEVVSADVWTEWGMISWPQGG